ncbi:MAG: caspase domain-containing protein [Trichodesmium sp.]
MANNWAIIIGINFYQHHPERRLKFAVQDAELMYDFLCNSAKFPRDHVFLCLGDEANSQNYPTYSYILKLLERDLRPDRIGQVDRFWFFFAGHGISRNGKDYLMTCDSLVEDIDLRIALSLDEVIACLRKHQNAEIVLVLDSCRETKGSRNFANSIGEETIQLAKSRGITTIFSCNYGQFSHELDSKKHGSFTYSLVEGLKQYTLPTQLENYLQKYVPKLNAEDNKSSNQTPIIRIEPVSKVNDFLLPQFASKADLDEIISLANREELKDHFDKASDLWWKVIRVSYSEEQKVLAQEAIERINDKKSKLLAQETIERINNQKTLDQDSARRNFIEKENSITNSLTPIPKQSGKFEDMNPDDWKKTPKKSESPEQSWWSRVVHYIFDEKG